MTTQQPLEVDVAAFQERRRDAGGIVAVMANGEKFLVPPPDLWPDDAQHGTDKRFLDQVMGDQADAFRAAGGTGRLVLSLISHRNELSAPESSASSGS